MDTTGKLIIPLIFNMAAYGFEIGKARVLVYRFMILLAI